ncbi:hypothetical protein F2Q69_00023047 [Brassica cretica]|uniref:Rhamnogalacturonase A/B/Epimerase-like pectate lyase domain-containing protein n=1 Tax=Brassica cretica TaxID=69181 RepID=A0A8S9QAW9_BRACR|nr:hypothetical protein F2Q69_00023047 [Brassica cretica]
MKGKHVGGSGIVKESKSWKEVTEEVLQEVDCIKEAGEGSGDQESRDSNWSTVPLEKVGRFSLGHVSVVQISASKYSVLTVDDQKEGETEMEGGEIAIDDQEDIEEETMEMCDQMIRSEEDQLEEDILEHQKATVEDAISRSCRRRRYRTRMLNAVEESLNRVRDNISGDKEDKIQLPGDSLALSVADFGATGDGIHYDTSEIQSAINACNHHYTSSSSICRVKFPPGTYLTAKLHLRSGVLLDVTENAVLLGGPRIEDYPAETSSDWYVVVANNATDVGITGGGAIDGQGSKFVVRFDERKNVMVSWNQTGACLGDECRPRLVGFVDSTNVQIWNITLRDPAYWWSVLSLTYCWIRTKSSAIKLGSASWFEFKSLVFDNITIFESHRGLGMQIRDGGNVNGITFSNMNISTRYYDPSWWGRAEPIYITTCPRDSSSKEGSISNLLFVNITIVSENGVFLSGSPNGLLTDIKFKNMNITLRRWSNYTSGLVDYRPGCQGLMNHSATAGIIMEHVNGFSVENVDLKWSDDNLNAWNVPLEFRPSTVNNVSFVGFSSGLLHEIV